MLITKTKVLNLCKAFASGASANIKLSKTQLHTIEISRGFLDRLFRTITKTVCH